MERGNEATQSINQVLHNFKFNYIPSSYLLLIQAHPENPDSPLTAMSSYRGAIWHEVKGHGSAWVQPTANQPG